MRSAKSIGRIVGVLLLAQLVGLMVGFILVLPITPLTFMESAAANSPQIRVAVFALLACGALTIGIAIYAFPFFREHSYRMALWLFALSVIWFSMQAIDNQHILSMMSLSQQYTEGAAVSNGDFLKLIATSVRSERLWAHYTELLVIDMWLALFYAILFRFALVPRLLAGFALATVMVHTFAIPLARFVGYNQVLVLAYALLLSYVVMGMWLMVKGFNYSGLHNRNGARAQ